MKIYLSLTLLLTVFVAGAQGKPGYDSVLAKKLGADEYGMRKYVLCLLKRGSNTGIDSAQKEKLLQGHLQNIGRLAREGKLAIAGPFLDNGPYAGIFIFNAETVEQARALTATDPAVKAGLFDMELHPWYGSAALMQVVPLHGSLQKKNILE